jgi:NADPH:quinone reductase-like Zn-dependent oxidoreductase
LKIADELLGPLARPYHRAEHPDHIEDPADCSLIEGVDVEPVANEIGDDVGLEIGEGQDEIGLQGENFVDIRRGECAHSRLLETGETVLVLGASGGVGRAAIQLAHAMGARVLAGILRPERAASVRAAGADAVIDLSAADLRDSLRSQVYAATEGRGVDIILDPLGGPIFEAAMRALAWRGRLVVIGFAAGPISTIRTNYLLLKNVEISGLQISDYRKRRPAQVAACFAEIFSLHEEGTIRPAKAIAFPLGRAGEALAAVRDRRIAGRAVLQLYRQSPKQQTTTDASNDNPV